MPEKVKWGLVLIAQLPTTYVLVAVGRRFTIDAEQAQTLGQVFEGLLWLFIAAGWIGGSVLVARGCGELLQNRSRSITRAEHHTLGQQALINYAAA